MNLHFVFLLVVFLFHFSFVTLHSIRSRPHRKISFHEKVFVYSGNGFHFIGSPYDEHKHYDFAFLIKHQACKEQCSFIQMNEVRNDLLPITKTMQGYREFFNPEEAMKKFQKAEIFEVESNEELYDSSKFCLCLSQAKMDLIEAAFFKLNTCQDEQRKVKETLDAQPKLLDDISKLSDQEYVKCMNDLTHLQQVPSDGLLPSCTKSSNTNQPKQCYSDTDMDAIWTSTLNLLQSQYHSGTSKQFKYKDASMYLSIYPKLINKFASHELKAFKLQRCIKACEGNPSKLTCVHQCLKEFF